MESLLIGSIGLFIQQLPLYRQIKNVSAAFIVFLKYQNSFSNKAKNVLNQNFNYLNKDFLVTEL